MVPKAWYAVFAGVAFFHAPVARASDWVQPGGGTLAQVMDGGGTRTVFTLINLDGVPAPYTLSFYDDNGNPLTLSTTAGRGTSLSGTLAVNGTAIISTNGGGTTVFAGFAVLSTGNTIGGSVVFGLALPQNPLAEASCPLDTGQDNVFGIPFDHTTATEGIALAAAHNVGPVTITVTGYDQTGAVFLTDQFTLANMNHTAFMLPTRYPQTTGRKGYIVFKGSANFNVLGIRATNTTYTSITPVVPQGF